MNFTMTQQHAPAHKIELLYVRVNVFSFNVRRNANGKRFDIIKDDADRCFCVCV